MSRVLILGAGIAGFAAAIAARKVGADVTVIDGGGGSSALGGGLWDVATNLSSRHRVSIEDAIVDICASHPLHPYARLGANPVERIQEAHEAVLPALGIYRKLDLSSFGVRVVSDFGVIRYASTAQKNLLELPTNDAFLAVANMYGYRSTDPAFLSQALSDRLDSAIAIRDVALDDIEFGIERTPMELAQRLDKEDREAFLRSLSSVSAVDHAPLLCPPVLGIDPQGLSSDPGCGVAFGEYSAPMAGVQGMRLRFAILEGLRFAGCEVLMDRVEVLTPDLARLEVLMTSGCNHRPDAVILATGKHVGGGLAARHFQMRETTSSLPMYVDGQPEALKSSSQGSDPAVLYGASLLAGGPGFRQGVGYDDRFRPLARDGHPVCDRLFVAGDILDGLDPARDGSGLGSAATTGFFAGLNAATQ